METAQLKSTAASTADKIRQPKFKTVRRGYDPGQVLEYLSKVADRVQTLEDHERELDTKLQAATAQPGERRGWRDRGPGQLRERLHQGDPAHDRSRRRCREDP